MFRIVELYVRKPLKDLLNPCANIIRAVEPGPANIRAAPSCITQSAVIADRIAEVS
jgi:hypothetical protein